MQMRVVYKLWAAFCCVAILGGSWVVAVYCKAFGSSNYRGFATNLQLASHHPLYMIRRLAVTEKSH